MPPENVSPEAAEWAAQYEFWTKIISDETARLRWNEGFEPLECHLYELHDERGRLRKYVGSTRICGRDFEVNAYPSHDSEGKITLKLFIRVSLRKQHH